VLNELTQTRAAVVSNPGVQAGAIGENVKVGPALPSVDLQPVLDGGLSGQQLKEFRENGFINLGQLFTPAELIKTREAFQGVLNSNPSEVHFSYEGGSSNVKSIENWHNATPLLKAFARDQRVLDAVKSVIGPRVTFHQSKYNPKAPNKQGEPWEPHRGFTFWHFLDGVQGPDKMVSVFIALTDQTEENGAVYTWKGAHDIDVQGLSDETDFSNRKMDDGSHDTATNLSLKIKPEKLAEYDREFEKCRLTGLAGTVWLIDSRNLHASAENKSDQTRELIANVFRSTENSPQHPRQEYICGSSNEPLIAYSSHGIA
jgi:ectoine hydroxylase-related dioxygenase (phytanoyl-CoA dioxygenase family)